MPQNKKIKLKSDGIVYSTNKNMSLGDFFEQDTAPDKQALSLLYEKKGRGGKIAIVIDGFVGPVEDLKALAKELKSACGVGGSVKNGQIIIQGNHRDKLMQILKEKGHNVKRVGG